MVPAQAPGRMEEVRLEPEADGHAEDSLRPEAKGALQTYLGPEAGSRCPRDILEGGPLVLVAGKVAGWDCTRQPSSKGRK